MAENTEPEALPAAEPAGVLAAAFKDDVLLRFDVASEELLFASEKGRESLDVFSDTYDGMTFSSIVRGDGEELADLWWKVAAGELEA